MASNPLFSDTALERAGGTAVAEREPTAAETGGIITGPAAGGAGAVSASAPRGPIVDEGGRRMSFGGVTTASGVMWLVLLAGGWWGWQTVTEETVGIDAGGDPVVETTMTASGWFIAALVIGFGLAIFTAFKPQVARFTALPYALAQGVVLGVISHLFDAQWDGIALQAVLATAGVFLAMLVLYGLRILRATPRFVKGVIGATFGILALYLAGFLFSLFGVDLRFWDSATPLGIAISVVIVVVAALNLIIDFDIIERGVNEGWPARMDWYGAFALTVTLIWLYLEMLRLLAKLRES